MQRPQRAIVPAIIVVATDINNDGFLDLFVANDTTANFIFANRRGKRFEEIGFTAGVAYGPGGKARSGHPASEQCWTPESPARGEPGQ